MLIEDSIFASSRPGAIIQGASVAGLSPFSVVVTLKDNNAAIYSSDALPVNFPDLSLLEIAEFELGFAQAILPGRATGTSRVYGTIETTKIVAETALVPEPAALGLFGLGLVGLGLAARRRTTA